MTARVIALDLWRGPAGLLALALLGLGAVLLLGTPTRCDGQWAEAVTSLRSSGAWLAIPAILAAGVWRGGSAERRGLGDAIAASPRPGLQRAAVEGGTIALVGAGAYLVLLASVTVAEGCTGALTASSAAAATAGLLAIPAAAFAGLALGRAAAAPMAAPLALFAAVSVISVFGGWSGEEGDAMLLLPLLDDRVAADQVGVASSVGQALWFTGLAVSGWMFASRWPSRWKITRLAPALAGLAALAALGLV
jgi:hypothetical protein